MVHANQLPSRKSAAAYEDAHIRAMELAIRIQQLLQDLPAPGIEDQPMGWAQVEELTYANAKLSEVAHFLERV